MFIESFEVEGFGGLPKWEGALSRVVRVHGSSRALLSFGDALLLGCASFDEGAFRALLERWGCVNPVVVAEGAQWDAAPGIAAVVEGAGLLKVAVTFALDPPQFGALRGHASRDPRLVDALSEGVRVTVRTGARFSSAFDAVAIDSLGFSVGDVAFAVHGPERPAWLASVLRGLSGRLWRGVAPGARWGEKARSWVASDQRSVARALTALAAAPANLGEAVALPEGPAVYQGNQLVPMRHLGAEAAAGVIGAVFLSGADIVVVDALPAGDGWSEWLAAQAEAEASPLEQVVILGVSGGITLG